MATKHLLGLGHRRIIAMPSEPANPSNSLRLDGWSSALQKAGIRKLDDMIADCSVALPDEKNPCTVCSIKPQLPLCCANKAVPLLAAFTAFTIPVTL